MTKNQKKSDFSSKKADRHKNMISRIVSALATLKLVSPFLIQITMTHEPALKFSQFCSHLASLLGKESGRARACDITNNVKISVKQTLLQKQINCSFLKNGQYFARQQSELFLVGFLKVYCLLMMNHSQINFYGHENDHSYLRRNLYFPQFI